MKTNNLTDATKVLILVATVIVVCILCAVGFKMVNEGKSAVNASTNNLNSMTSQYQDVDIAIYDGADVQGSEVVSVIHRAVEQGKYLAIGVLTLRKEAGVTGNVSDSDYTYYNKYFTDASTALADNTTSTPVITYSSIEDATNPESQVDYINPFAAFSGKVLKDENGLIICVQFTQLD